MSAGANALEKLHILETLYRAGYQSDVIELALDKLIALERGRVEVELAELDVRLQEFEARYQMSSEEFYRGYELGELGDSADFTEWASFYDMRRLAQRQLDWLAGKLA